MEQFHTVPWFPSLPSFKHVVRIGVWTPQSISIPCIQGVQTHSSIQDTVFRFWKTRDKLLRETGFLWKHHVQQFPNSDRKEYGACAYVMNFLKQAPDPPLFKDATLLKKRNDHSPAWWEVGQAARSTFGHSFAGMMTDKILQNDPRWMHHEELEGGWAPTSCKWSYNPLNGRK